MASDVELKPCPFCGAAALAYLAFPSFEEGWAVDVEHADDCPLLDWAGHCHKTEAAAIAAWNTRPTLPEQDALRIDAKQADTLHRAHIASLDMVQTPAADELSSLRERVEALEAAARLVVECDTPDAMKVANLRALLSQEGGPR